jgi:hypothetical protein
MAGWEEAAVVIEGASADKANLMQQDRYGCISRALKSMLLLRLYVTTTMLRKMIL